MKRYGIIFFVITGIITHFLISAEPIPSSQSTELKFITVPPVYGQVAVKYTYNAKAVSMDTSAVITYYLDSRSPSGASVDSASGKLEWIPSISGIFHFRLVAHASNGANAVQDFSVLVTNGSGVIAGKVIDTVNVGVPNIIIEAFSTANDSTLSFAYSARTNENGNYWISHVNPGSYKLRAFSPSGKYLSQWYEGKDDISQADIITVADSPAVSVVNFKLHSVERLLVTVNGKVTDTLGVGIGGTVCRVVFVRAEFALNFGPGLNSFDENFRKYFELNSHTDFRLEGNSEFVFKTHPDSITGEYQIKLPVGRYIAFARAKGYATEFYQEASDLLSADIIPVPDPRMSPIPATIDFTLAPLPPVAFGSISGFVKEYSPDGNPVPSRVIAFRDRWRHLDVFRTARAYVTDTDSLGNYSFDELLPGSYVVMAVPLGPFAPSFYTGIDSADHWWIHAKKIEINGNYADNINIYVKPLGEHANGFTSINGTVAMNANGWMAGISSRAGALVYAVHNGWISGYGITNSGGNYNITGLAPGEYSVSVDKAGFNQVEPINVTIGYDSGIPVSGTADFTISTVTSVSENNITQLDRYTLAQNYPNPFNPSTIIKYFIPTAGKVSINVYDLLGKEVATLVNRYQNSGEFSIQFNASNLPSGVYFYKLTAGSYHSAKKMLLLK